MKDLILKIRNSEFLSLAEVLRLKVSLVLIFLFIFGSLTIPFSIFEDLSLEVRIIVPVAFFILFTTTFIMLVVNKVRISMHFSIYTFIGLTIYYMGGSSELYGYLLLFITLTIIIFYQDIYTYIIYGGALTAYGVIYIINNGDMMAGLNITQAGLSSIIYQFALIGFFLVFLLYFIISETSYESLNNNYLKTEKFIERYRKFTVKYVDELNEKNDINQYFEQPPFHQAVSELSVFINEFLQEDYEKISEVIEFYFFLHNQSIDEVLEKEDLPKETIKYAKQFKKYLLNKNNELEAIVQEVAAQKKATHTNINNHYDYNINAIFTNRSNRLIAFATIYKFLRSEVTQLDKWGRVDRVLNHQEIKELLQTKPFREYISFEDVNFFLNNEELFDKFLK